MDFAIVAPYEQAGARRQLDLRVRAPNVVAALALARRQLEAVLPLLGPGVALLPDEGPFALTSPLR